MATKVEPMERLVGAFSKNLVYDALLHRLAEISATRAGNQGAKDLVDRYNIVLLCLIELGYDKPLDYDICLLDELMTSEYHRKDGWRIRTTTPRTEVVKEPQKS